MDDEKKHKQELFKEFKEETLEKNKNLIGLYRKEYEDNEKEECDLTRDEVRIEFCESNIDIQKWKAFVHLTTALPWRGAVGRQVKLFVKSKNHILGMIHLTSPLAQTKVRDNYLNFTDKWEELKNIYNIETCVPTRKYSNYLTGKLLIYSIFSLETKSYLDEKYNSNTTGYETTSLYGKSSIYNRIPFFKYLGLTEGLSAVYIKDDVWKEIIKEYYEVYPRTETKRLAPVKFQIVDKLKKYYDKMGKEFPYTYKSEEFKRGVYFGYIRNLVLEDSVKEWQERWLLGRMERLNLD